MKDKAESNRHCLKNDNTSKWRSFFRHTVLLFLEIHKEFLLKSALSDEKSSPLVILLLFKQGLTYMKYSSQKKRTKWVDSLEIMDGVIP